MTTVRQLRAALFELPDQDAIIGLWDDEYLECCHVHLPLQVTEDCVLINMGGFISEEDVS